MQIKWALGSITMGKASRGYGISVELFQILKDDAVKVLHSICQQIWKTQQWPQNWKRSEFIAVCFTEFGFIQPLLRYCVGNTKGKFPLVCKDGHNKGQKWYGPNRRY